jgi:hypothetical protein
VDYVEGYGPEAWTLDYHIHQEEVAANYWQTRVLRPSYTQLYPPDKGRPRTLIEVRYPPADRAKDEPELLDLLHQNDPRLSAARSGNEITTKSLALVIDGQSQKSAAAADIDFLKSALHAVASQQSQLSMADVDFLKGFQWVIEPPRSATPPPADAKPQEPGAPSLLHKAGT